MTAIEIYKKIRKCSMDRGVIATRVEPSKKGRGSYTRKNKYGKFIEYIED